MSVSFSSFHTASASAASGFSRTRAALAVQNSLGMIDVKVVMIPDMGFHFTEIIALQMKKLSAVDAFQMKVLIANAVLLHVLIAGAFSSLDEIPPDGALGYQLVQVTVYGGFAHKQPFLVQRGQDLVGSDMPFFIFDQTFQDLILLFRFIGSIRIHRSSLPS
jgi:hypothetical protein